MDYKTLYIIDTVKYERLQLAKFLKQENFTIMSFLNLADCFKKPNPLRTDLIIYVVRKGEADLKNLERVKKKDRAIHMILVIMTPDTPVDLERYREMGYENLHVATNNEKVREITYGLLAPDGLTPRTETPLLNAVHDSLLAALYILHPIPTVLFLLELEVTHRVGKPLGRALRRRLLSAPARGPRGRANAS